MWHNHKIDTRLPDSPHPQHRCLCVYKQKPVQVDHARTPTPTPTHTHTHTHTPKISRTLTTVVGGSPESGLITRGPTPAGGDQKVQRVNE